MYENSCNLQIRYTDVILFSDVWLGKKSKEVCNLFSKQYKCLFNSSGARRRVGILYKKYLDMEVTDTYRDMEENILVMKCRISGDCV